MDGGTRRRAQGGTTTKPIPDLGPCEGRWVTIFGDHRRCGYRASESFDSPCGHIHILCATCVYALERGIGSWDELADFVDFGEGSSLGSDPRAVSEGIAAVHPLHATAPFIMKRHRVAGRLTRRVPVHVSLVGIVALAALVIALLPTLVVAAPTAIGTTVVLYVVASRAAVFR